MKRMMAFMLFALMTLCAAFAAADALYVSREDGVGVQAVSFTGTDYKTYLFLPAYMAEQTLEVHLEGYDALVVGDEEIRDGETTGSIAGGQTITLKKGKRETAVSVMSGSLPAVHLQTESGNLDYIHKKKGNKEKADMMIVMPDGTVDYDAPIAQMKGHGNATFVYEKKSYQVKLEKKASLLSMDESKTFVLIANQHENSLLRNRITFELADALELPYTPDCRSVDLFVNGEFRGSYLLADKIGISSGSVDVVELEKETEKLNEAFLDRGGEPEAYGKNGYQKGTYKGGVWPKEPEDVTGGYLFELEYEQRYADEVSGVVTERGQAIVVKSPEWMGEAQGEYVNNLLNSFERAIFAEDGVDAKTGMHYTDLADFDSLVRKYMIEETCKNYDGNKSSQYFFKDTDEEDEMIYAGPVWDYDSAWGNYAPEGRPKVAGPQGMTVAEGGESYSWWPALSRQNDFAAEVKDVYAEELRPLLCVLIGDAPETEELQIRSLDSYAKELDASAQMNFKRWRVLNHSSREMKTGATYEENIEYLRDWIRERMRVLDAAWGIAQ